MLITSSIKKIIPHTSSDVMTKSSSTSLNFFLEETNTFDNSLPESETFCFDLEKNSSGRPQPDLIYSLRINEAFNSDDYHIIEKVVGSIPTTHADFSQYDSFIFDLSINPLPPADRSDLSIIGVRRMNLCPLTSISPPSMKHILAIKFDSELGNLTMMSRIFEASRARGICPSITRASQSSASFGNPDILILSTNEMDIREKDEKSSKNGQNQSRNGRAWKSQMIVGIDWLSKRKFVIVCHEKVVKISFKGSRKLRVQGERTLGAAKALMNVKVEFRIDLVHGATSVAKSPYRLAPLEMQELSEQLRELQDKVLELLRKEKLYAKFTKSEAVKNWEVPTTPSEL
ncbi:hypothetical protein Tco_0088783 [Tanacetum coccineum]